MRQRKLRIGSLSDLTVELREMDLGFGKVPIYGVKCQTVL